MTESEVQRSFRNLFRSKDFGKDEFETADGLIEKLPPESPLRNKLTVELEELREIAAAKA